MSGKLIVLEGTDGSGKATQARMMGQRLQREGIAFREIKGERFALLVYDVTITPTTPAPPAP